ncbi:MAG: shikimate dehydrogenase [Bacteroidia bacterium]|nr:shikimate dehydrogenase [Bacteroidia bacterium]
MRLFGLIGYPVSHSFSKKYFSLKFRNQDINDAIYELFPLKHIEDFPEMINRNPELCGLNITIPYKEKIIPYIVELDKTVSETGAVNTIKFIRKNNLLRLKGYNTDITGFEALLNENAIRKNVQALILGTGGAAKAVAHVLKLKNICYSMVSRTKGRAHTLTYNKLKPDLIKQNRLIINTTPLGMFPDIQGFPLLPYEAISNQHILIDLVYNPVETLFLKYGKTRGAKTFNGLKMFHAQAEKAWEIWNTPDS